MAILDTPPAAGPQAYTASQAADLVLIPCRPSLIDLDAIRRTAQLIKAAGVSTPSGSESPASTSKGLMAKSQAWFHRFGWRPERRT